MAESQRPTHPDFARADELIAQLEASMEQLSRTMAQLETKVEMHRKMSLIAEAFGGKPLPPPPELEGWV
jgi:hypothetical protein